MYKYTQIFERADNCKGIYKRKRSLQIDTIW